MVKQALVQAYLKKMGYPADSDWISGTVPGSVHYAFDPIADVYLAWAGFELSTTAPDEAGINMQDGGFRSWFQMPVGGQWQPYDDICSTPALVALIGANFPTAVLGTS
jgi:hypothetical protein